MAKKVTIQLIDDIDETTVEPGNGESITFAVNGVSYEIDLGSKNATEFHRKMDYYIAHATKVSEREVHRKTTKPSASRAMTGNREQLKAIREWAAASGYTVSSRGRISAEIKDAFAAAH